MIRDAKYEYLKNMVSFMGDGGAELADVADTATYHISTSSIYDYLYKMVKQGLCTVTRKHKVNRQHGTFDITIKGLAYVIILENNERIRKWQ